MATLLQKTVDRVAVLEQEVASTVPRRATAPNPTSRPSLAPTSTDPVVPDKSPAPTSYDPAAPATAATSTAIDSMSVSTPLVNATGDVWVKGNVYVRGSIVYQGVRVPVPGIPSPWPTATPTSQPTQVPTSLPSINRFCVLAFADPTASGNMAVCNWGEPLTWFQGAANAYLVDSSCAVANGGAPTESCWRLCRTTEFKARFSSLSPSFPTAADWATGGWLWGYYYKQGPEAGTSYDMSTYTCQGHVGSCHSTEGGNARGTATGDIYTSVGCGNNQWYGGSCSYCDDNSPYYGGCQPAITSNMGFYCRGT